MAQSRAREKKRIEKKARQARRRRIKRIRAIAILSAAVIVVLLGLFFWVGPGKSQPGTFVPSLGNRHVPNIDSPHIAYNSDPPTSGPHIGTLAAWGIHEIPVPDEQQVHNLEDQGVVIQYNDDLDEASIATLREIVGGYRRLVILAPRPDMESPITLTAWTRIRPLDGVDRRAIGRFIRAYRGLDHHPR